MKLSDFQIENIRWLGNIEMYMAAVQVKIENEDGETANVMQVRVRFKGQVDELFSSIELQAVAEAVRFLKLVIVGLEQNSIGELRLKADKS